MSMITYLWILKTRKYCGVLFAKQNMQMLMICPNDLLYEKNYENTSSLMGSFLWRLTLNMHAKVGCPKKVCHCWEN